MNMGGSNTGTSAARLEGAMPAWLPYFYYQLPRDSYPDATRIGDNWSTPKNGSCAEGMNVGDNRCTWRRQPFAKVIFGQQLLDKGWNNTVVQHWPLHEFGPNTTQQYETNQPVFDVNHRLIVLLSYCFVPIL
jgi:hypothetical protein